LLITIVGGGLQALFTLRVAAIPGPRPVRSGIQRWRAERARRRGVLRASPVRPDSILAVLAAASITGGVIFLLYAVHLDARHRTAEGTVAAVSAYQSCGAEACDVTNYRITVRYRPADGRP
jgi:anti-sigma factor RsiW